MKDREELHKLVVSTLQVSIKSQSASQIYNNLLDQNPKILWGKKIKGFKSFVKVINQFQDIDSKDYSGQKVYFLKSVINK